jgi:hypothetical protein
MLLNTSKNRSAPTKIMTMTKRKNTKKMMSTPLPSRVVSGLTRRAKNGTSPVSTTITHEPRDHSPSVTRNLQMAASLVPRTLPGVSAWPTMAEAISK